MGPGAQARRVSRSEVFGIFPRLRRTSFGITSLPTNAYNCIAWAAGDTDRRWWPGKSPFFYWPATAPVAEHVDSFLGAFKLLGYEPCVDGSLERGFEKVAFYGLDSSRPKHAARQLPSGLWTSKLGSLEDVQHTLYGLEGGLAYGDVLCVARRPAP